MSSKRIGFRMIVVVALILLLSGTSSAFLKYKDEPKFSAFIAGSNHIEKGSETQLMLFLQNSAIFREIDYYGDYYKYQFLNNQRDLLLTAHNVSVEFTSPEGIEILSPPQSYSVVPAFQPLQIPLLVKASGDLEAGEYYIEIRIKYEAIDDVDFVQQKFSMPYSQITREIQSYYNTTTFPPVLEKQVVINETLLPEFWFDDIKFDFEKKEQVLKIKIIVEESPVKLEVVDIKEEGMVAGGKGKITLTVRNSGEMEAKNAFLMLSTPSGFTSRTTLQELPSFDSLDEALKPLLQMMQFQQNGGGVEIPELDIPPQLKAALSQGSIYVGDLQPGEKINVTFSIDVSTEEEGYYPFQIYAAYLDEYGDVKQTPAVAFGVKVSPPPEIKIVEEESKVYVGSKGDYRVKIDVSQPIKDVMISIESSPPITTLVSESYLGDVEGQADVLFRVKASSDAEPGISYPVKLHVTYKLNGKEREEILNAGLSVLPKMKFEVSGKGVIPAGSERLITVEIINAGEFEITEATARITIVDPFSTTDDTAYLGTLKPKESRKATFKLKVDRDATQKEYALNLEVKYKDASGEWVISDPVKLPIEVTKSESKISQEMMFAIAFAVVAIIGAAFYLRGKKKE